MIFLLLVANILRFIFSGWGLITIHAHDMPLGQIVKSIERQGWVTIYTDMDLTTPVSMDVDHVPLAEAMDTLTANSEGQWKLGFFVAPTSAQVKQEIRAFQSKATDDNTKVYSYPTFIPGDIDTPASDPRLQSWAGYKAPPPAPPPAPGTDGQTNAAPDPPPAPSTVQDYLQALAEQTDIWIMAPGSWEPHVSGPPAPSSSITSAVKSLVSSANGAVESAIILHARQGRPGGGSGRHGFFGGDTGWSYMEDRVRSAIQGLPEAARPAALAELNDEVDFQKQVQLAPPDQRRGMMRDHMMKHMGDNFWRQSPEKRAQRYQQAVANRQAAHGA